MNSNKNTAANSSASGAAALLDQLEMWGLKLGLERIQAVLDELERPDRAYKIVLVAGTNGKGSTAATLASILFRSGYRVGLFTSPHLESVRERIRINGKSIAEPQLFQCLSTVKEAAAKRPSDPLPSYFEAVTASALLYFAQSKVDIAVLEVGLGGRLDATNATEPLLSLITSIAHDHQEHLGHRLDQIAREKAGVARVGRPLLAWAAGQAGVQRVLRDVRATGVDVEEAWRGLEVLPSANALQLGTVRITSASSPPDGPPRTYTLQKSATAQHQAQNIALAVRAAERLSLLGFDAISHETILEGAVSCRWPGRLERVRLPEIGKHPQEILLDGAHNRAGARALATYLTTDGPDPKPALVFGSLKGKNAVAALTALAPVVGPIWVTAPTSSRALSSKELMQQLRRYRPNLAERCRRVDSFPQAMETAISSTRDRLVVCGSLYGVGEARRWLFERFGVPVPAADLILFEQA